MPRDSGLKRQHLRSRIAHQAARLMAQDGIADFGLAKRKAAYQAGVANLRELPTNEEVEEALRAYQSLYQGEEQRTVLKHLRKQALSMMRLLKDFNPHLTGSVLSGTAGRHSDVNLQLFVDSVKDVELFLLNRQIPYKRGERRLYVGEELQTIPLFTVEGEDVEVKIAVFATNDQRHALKTSPDGKPLERARAVVVENLLRL
ncbi:MAG TPA: UDP-N-acetylmuramate--alanine ligase [Burkholderiales bacterium]|nr:UDP-N-acetylmuramate--alanine ligase [Burkholderiales bacterium]